VIETMRILRIVTAAALATVAASAHAHHSFAVFFDPSKSVKVTGKVKEFRFTNPHGLVVLEVTEAPGKVREWRAETNAPVVLVRRGWKRDSLKPGDVVTIEGWPSRDGKPYIRLQRATFPDGRLVGTAPFQQNQQS
jgi:hypothetical protein